MPDTFRCYQCATIMPADEVVVELGIGPRCISKQLCALRRQPRADTIANAMGHIIEECAPDVNGQYDLERQLWNVEQIARGALSSSHVYVPYQPGCYANNSNRKHEVIKQLCKMMSRAHSAVDANGHNACDCICKTSTEYRNTGEALTFMEQAISTAIAAKQTVERPSTTIAPEKAKQRSDAAKEAHPRDLEDDRLSEIEAYEIANMHKVDDRLPLNSRLVLAMIREIRNYRVTKEALKTLTTRLLAEAEADEAPFDSFPEKDTWFNTGSAFAAREAVVRIRKILG